ncbi:MAG: biosynthetic-type acetolactate synthase large subunit [Coriobacteriia bacterium]|nr:biosynthetic-type acetolactate synthase large subunit [Coriobacteriia bacterium]
MSAQRPESTQGSERVQGSGSAPKPGCASKPERVIGAEALVRCLEEEGVGIVFGYPGGVALPIFDALYSSEKVATVLPRHEQGAVHMADGYARTSGRPGVAVVTSGPGAANTITGIANAYLDSIPLVVVTAQVATAVIGTDAFQEIYTTGITLPVTKHSYLVKDVAELPQTVKEAFHIAATGRPGPVVIDMPVDVSKSEIDFAYPASVSLPGYKPSVRGHGRQVKEAVALIKSARRPLLYAGGGILAAEASRELKETAELMQIPVATTMMGKGSFPEDHHLWIGMPGMHGAKYTNFAITETDLLIAVGARFDDRVTGKLASFATKARIIHIDIDPAEIGKNKVADCPIVGDAKNVLSSILAELRKSEAEPKTQEWIAKIDGWRKQFPLHYGTAQKGTAQKGTGQAGTGLAGSTGTSSASGPAVLYPQFVVERLSALTKDRETVITTEVGQNQMWACQFYSLREPRTWVSSGGLGTMGFGLPAAIGAQAARPDALVVDIAGDGSIQMNIQELATARLNGYPVKVVVLNNGFLGMVRQWQELFYGRRYASSVISQEVPDLVMLAEAYGCFGIRVTEPTEVDAALLAAFEFDGPAVVDCRVAPEECVYPMVAPGSSIDEMLGGIPGGPVSEMLDDEVAEEVQG